MALAATVFADWTTIQRTKSYTPRLRPMISFMISVVPP